MKDKLRDEYIKHIKSITLKRDLRQFAIEFYDDLCKKYKGQVFRRDNFETLDVDEQEIEQDVAKHVFKDKDTATAEEIFTFLIKQNVKSMFIGKQKDMLDENTAGFLNPSLQLLGIKKIDLEISGVMVNSRMSKKEIKQKEKQALQEAMQVQKQKYKQVVYHELSHVFEVKTFGDRKFYKNSHGVFFKAGRLKYISTNSQYIRQENFAKDIERDQLIIKHKYQDTPTDILNSLKRNGKVAIFEIFNENSSQKIRQDELDLLRGQIIGVKSENAHCKILLEGFCGYNKNYPMLEILKAALPDDATEMDFKFNTKRLEDNFNKLNISKQMLNDAKIAILNDLCSAYGQAYKQVSKNASDEEIRKVVEDEYQNMEQIVDGLKNASVTDVIYTLMGVAENCEGFEATSNCKKELQAILIESIKNDVISQLKDEKIAKNQEFFEKIDAKLKKVENCLYYPDILTQFVKRNPSNPLNPNKYNDYTLPIWTAERFANDEHCTKNVKIFAELAGAVKESLNKNKQNLQDYDKAASFFKEQDMIEQKYQDALHEQALAKQEYDFAIKARDERYKRQQEQQVKVYGEEWA